MGGGPFWVFGVVESLEYTREGLLRKATGQIFCAKDFWGVDLPN